MISPLGLYYFFDGTVVHSDDGPEAALRWLELNEKLEDGEESFGPAGAIQPDSRVLYEPGDATAQFIYFNAKARRLEPKNTSEGTVFCCDETPGPYGWCAYHTRNSSPSKLHCFIAEAKLDAYMAAFEALQP